ncbi:hypothetical protein AVEN_205853-1 [Araneus ventricosus]|uniref:Uncharacterized protein n=1 Tax=Araneus ventricosus TaxID=182803 RepID=A0A4Y2Q5U9_ARAVE|nr:hypothetical protein AVEN_205853-1 [Araneus ventricosus]
MGSRNIAPDGEARPSTSPTKENIADDRFFVLNLKEGSFMPVSPIKIHKTILAIVGDVKAIKKCITGKLLVETANAKQAALIVKLEKIGEKEITVAPHYSLNTTKGVISESEFQNDTEADIMGTKDSQQDLKLREIPVANPKSKFSSNTNRGGLPNMEKDKRENTSTKPNQSLSRSLIPKINQNLEAEGKVTHIQSKSEEQNDEPEKAYNGLRPLPRVRK